MIKNLFSQTTLRLGRWAPTKCTKTEEIVIHHANQDHCGDILCGFPSEYKKKSEQLFNDKYIHKKPSNFHLNK